MFIRKRIVFLVVVCGLFNACGGENGKIQEVGPPADYAGDGVQPPPPPPSDDDDSIFQRKAP